MKEGPNTMSQRLSKFGLSAMLSVMACRDEPLAAEPSTADSQKAPVVSVAAPEVVKPVHTEAASPEPKPAPEPSPEVDPEPKPELEAVYTPPSISRSDDRLIVSNADAFELVLTPRGLAFIQSAQLWILDEREMTLQHVSTSNVPHDLACDGRWLYWLDHPVNGKLKLPSGTAEFLPPMSYDDWGGDLAVGDVLYGISRGDIHRFANDCISRVATLDDLPVGSLPGFAAGDRVVVLPVAERGFRSDEAPVSLLRWRVDGTFTKIPIHRYLTTVEWSVRRDGTVVFLGADDEVLRLDAKASSAHVLFVEPGIKAVCWCGKDVCTYDADDDVIRRHRRAAAESTIIVDRVGQIGNLACGAHRMAWSAMDEDERTSKIFLVNTR